MKGTSCEGLPLGAAAAAAVDAEAAEAPGTTPFVAAMAAFWALTSAVVLPYQNIGGAGGSFFGAAVVAAVGAGAAMTGGTG